MTPIHIFPDVHVPFHDKRAWKLNLKVIKERKPKILITLGDLADVFSLSKHAKNPLISHNWTLKKEIMAVNAALDELEAVVPRDCKKYYIQGNHEERIDRYVADHPEMQDMFPTEDAFNLIKRGWHYTPYRKHVKIGEVFYTHDTGKAGASAHTQAERAFSDNAVIGHTHRMAYTIAGNSRGAPHVAAMFGWLGDINAAEYMHQINARRDWTLGFGTGWIAAGGVTYLQPHPIINYTACVDGVLYK